MTIVAVAAEIARAGPRMLSAKKIAELALQRIGAFSVNDTAADPVHLARTLDWMDLVVQEFTGNTKCFWLVSRRIPIPLTANVSTYDLQDAMGDDLPAGNVLFPLSAMLADASNNETPLTLLDWDQYEEISNKTRSGTPSRIYIDRATPRMELRVHPVPAVAGFTLYLTAQQYAPDMTAGGGDIPHGLRAEFQMWMVLATATQIGKGPVKRLSLQVSNDLANEANGLRAVLKSYANREQPMRGQPERTEAWGA